MAQPCMSLLRRAPARKAVGMHLGHVTEEELAWTVEPAGVLPALGSEGMSSKRRPKRHDELHVWPLSPGLIRDDALLDSGEYGERPLAVRYEQGGDGGAFYSLEKPV